MLGYTTIKEEALSVFLYVCVTSAKVPLRVWQESIEVILRGEEPIQIKHTYITTAEFYQRDSVLTTKDRTLDHVYNHLRAIHRTLSCSHFSHSDHSSVLSISAYLLLLKA